MKDSHLYNRLSNPTAVKVIMHMIRNDDIKTVHELYSNLLKEANDHPGFNNIKNAYEQRVNTQE